VGVCNGAIDHQTTLFYPTTQVVPATGTCVFRKPLKPILSFREPVEPWQKSKSLDSKSVGGLGGGSGTPSPHSKSPIFIMFIKNGSSRNRNLFLVRGEAGCPSSSLLSFEPQWQLEEILKVRTTGYQVSRSTPRLLYPPYSSFNYWTSKLSPEGYQSIDIMPHPPSNRSLSGWAPRTSRTVRRRGPTFSSNRVCLAGLTERRTFSPLLGVHPIG